jgi:hypothetical protein
MLVKIEAYFDGEHWCARGIGQDIFTQGKTLDQLMKNIEEAVHLHFEDRVNAGDTLNILVLSEAEVKGAPKVTTS